MEVISAPVGYVTSSRAEPYDDGWDDEVATITVDGERFDAEALQGLDQFSHAEIVYHFDRAPSTGIIHGARHRGPVHQPAWATELMRGYWSAADERPIH